MTSIRHQLLVGLIAAVIVAGALAALGVNLQARQEAGALFDYHLRQMALSLRDQNFENLAAIDGAPYEDFDFAIEVRSEDGTQLYYSRSRRRVLLAADAAPGYATESTAQGLWRVYTLQQRGFTMRVAQPMEVRDALAARSAWRTLMPFVLLLPLLGIVVWFVVTRGLRPLEAVASAVKARTPTTLHPLPQSGLPAEIAPVVSSLNDLLGRLQRALDVQRAFVADAAHELRTPLTALRLQIELAQRAADPAERASAFATVEEGLSRATHVVEQLLTLARQEPEAGERPMSDVDMAALAREVVGRHAAIAETRHIDLGVARADANAVVRGEEPALRTLISNLVDNAVRYTPEEGRIDVSAIVEDGAVALEVTDTGPGIPAEDRERVFDRFYRRNSGDATGSGLGLAIVRTIAQRHGARVSLDTPPSGRGLRARVQFDRAS